MDQDNPNYTRICGVLQESGILLGDVTVGESLDGENAPNLTTESRFHLPANTQREIL